jgi:DNA end-binding protein Ku
LKKVSAETGEDVPDENIVKGYEISKGQYVVVDPTSWNRSSRRRRAASTSRSSSTLRDRSGVLRLAVHPRPRQDTQALRTAGAGDGGAGKVAIGRFVMRNKQYVAAVRASEGTLLLSTMVFADEVVSKDSIEELEVLDSIEVSSKEVKMASRWSNR